MFIPPVAIPQSTPAPIVVPPLKAPAASDWETYFDEKKGKPYYYNRITKKTTWKKPDELKTAPELNPQNATNPSAGTGANVNANASGAQPKPIKTKSFLGSKVWKRVFCDTGDVYYYNTETKEVTWTAPKLPASEEGVQRTASPTADKLKMRTKEKDLAAIDAVLGKGDDDDDGPKNAKNDNDNEDEKEEDDGEDIEEPLAKRCKQYESEEEHQERIRAFQEMLQRTVKTSAAKWDELLPTLACEAGFGGILEMGERRALFEDHVKARAREEQAEARANAKQNSDGFRALFDELSDRFDSTVSFVRFMGLAGDDVRFTRLEPRERERYFRECTEDLRRREVRESAGIREEFVAILRDLFPEDVVGPAWAKMVPAWDNVKKFLSMDDRYKAFSDSLLRMSDRRSLFMDYYSDVKARYVEKKKSQDKLEEKQRSLQRKYEREKREREKNMEIFAVKEAEKQALALIAERIKDPDFDADKAYKELENDPRWTDKRLRRRAKEDLLHKHRCDLMDARIADYDLLLREQEAKGEITLGTTWEDFEEKVGADPRFVKMPRSFNKKAAFLKHLNGLIDRALSNLVELLKENRMVYKGIKMDSQQYRNAARVLAVNYNTILLFTYSFSFFPLIFI